MPKAVEQRLRAVQETLVEMNQTITDSVKKIEKIIVDIMSDIRVEAAKIEASGFEPSLLLRFPDHLRITVRALLKLGVATAEDVSHETKRSRSLESTYLNHLVTMGYAEKERRGQRIYYRIKFDQTAKVTGE